jgi:hypothetical protein
MSKFVPLAVVEGPEHAHPTILGSKMAEAGVLDTSKAWVRQLFFENLQNAPRVQNNVLLSVFRLVKIYALDPFRGKLFADCSAECAH